MTEMATQKLTIRLGLDGVSRVTGGLREVSAVAQSSLGSLSRLAMPVAGLAATALGLRSIATGLRSIVEEGGKLTDVRSATGVAMDRLVRYQQMFVEAGRSAGDVTGVFARMEQAVFQAATQGGQAAAAMQRLGLNLDDLAQRSPDEQFEQIGRAIAGIEHPTLRSAAAMQIFGRSGTELMPLFEILGDSERTDRALGRLPELLARNAQTLDAIGDGFTQLKLKGQQFWVGVLDQIAPSIDKIVQGFAGIDLTGIGQKVGALIQLAIDMWRESRFSEFISLSIEAGFQMGFGAARRSISDTLHSAETWKGLTLGLMSAINSAVSSGAKMIIELAVPLGAVSRFAQDALVSAFAVAINYLAAGLEQVINKSVTQLNRLPGVDLSQVSFGQRSAQGTSWERSMQETLDKIEPAMAEVDAFFARSNTALRDLLDVRPVNENIGALDELKSRIQEILDLRERSAVTEESVNGALSTGVGLTNVMAQLRRDEAAILAGIVELQRQRALIEGNFGLNDAQKFQARLEFLRKERAELEKAIALLRQRMGIESLSDQEREQIAQRIDTLQRRLANVDIAIGTAGPNPESIGEQMEASLTNLENQFGTTAQAIARSFEQVIGTAVDSVSGGLQVLIGDTRYWTHQLGTVAGPIMGALTGAISRMFTEWIAKRVMLSMKEIALAKAETAAKMPSALLTSIKSFGIAAALGAAAMGVAMAAFGGFREGGYTGDAPRDKVAGFVHGQEFVFDAPSVARVGLDNLEALRSGQPLAPTAAEQSSSPAQTSINIAAFDDRVDVKKWAESSEGEAWFVDMAKRTAHQLRS